MLPAKPQCQQCGHFLREAHGSALYDRAINETRERAWEVLEQAAARAVAISFGQGSPQEDVVGGHEG
jgi:hypothetical protein